MSQAPADLIEIRGPSALGGGWRRARDLLYLMAAAEFRRTYLGTALGYLWSLARPLMLFAVLLVVFTQAFDLGERVEQCELLGRQLDLLPRQPDRTGARIDGELPHAEQPLPAPPLRAPEHRPHPPEQLRVQKRLADVIVSPAREAPHAIRLGHPAGEHEQPGTDVHADAEDGEVERAQAAAQPMPGILRVAEGLLNGFGAE